MNGRSNTVVGGLFLVGMGVVVVAGIFQASQGGSNSLVSQTNQTARVTVGTLFTKAA